MPTEAEIAWAAGFIKGDGSMRVAFGTTPVLRASGNDVEPLQRLCAIFGGRIAPSKTTAAGNTSYEWSITGAAAAAAARRMYPWWSARRRAKADEVFGALVA